MKRVTAWMVGLAMIGFLVAASGTAWAETLKIGVLSALSGPGSEWGLAQDGGMKIVAMEINNSGGLKVGGKTYKIEVVSYDDQYKAANAVAAATRLVEQDKVNFVMGPMGSASGVAVKPIFEKNKIIALYGAYTNKVLDSDTKYIFRMFPTSAEYIGPIVTWIRKNKPNLKTVAEVEPNDETGWFSQRLIKEHYTKEGFQIIASELFERNTKDFAPLLTRILAHKPDIIELGTTPPPTAGLVMRQARELGFNGQFVKIGGPGAPQIVAAAGKDFAEGLICYGVADQTTQKYKWLEEQYAKVLKPPMNAFTVYFYDASNMLFDAMRKAGTVTDTDKVAQEMEKITPYDGIQGKIVWGGKENYGVNHQILTPLFIGTIHDGQEQVLGKIEQ